MPRKTDTRENILDFIRAFRRENGYSPSVREVARHCGIKSPSVVQYHLDQLEQTGLITRERDRSRSVGIVGEEGEVPQVPLLGIIAAGQPIGVPSVDRWGSEAQRMVDVPREILKSGKDLFALETRSFRNSFDCRRVRECPEKPKNFFKSGKNTVLTGKYLCNYRSLQQTC